MHKIWMVSFITHSQSLGLEGGGPMLYSDTASRQYGDFKASVSPTWYLQANNYRKRLVDNMDHERKGNKLYKTSPNDSTNSRAIWSSFVYAANGLRQAVAQYVTVRSKSC